jgi:hypothetical protein
MSDAEAVERSDELIVSIPQLQALDIFVGGATSIDPFLADIRRAVDSFQPDVSTAKGRAAIASVARKVASAKVRIDDIGKDLVAKQKEIPNKIDATRRYVRETLDRWRDEVRQPLTEWERIEKDRKDRQTSLLAETVRLSACGTSWDEINDAVRAVEALKPHADDDEQFAGQLALAKESARATLEQRLAARERYDAEQAELVRLRELERQQQQAAREERLAKEAAEAAAAEATRQVKAEADAAIRRAEEAARAAEAKAEAARRAIEDERQREANRKAAEEAEKVARERDVAHRASIKGEAVKALYDAGIKTDLAHIIINMIAARQVPHVTIQY